MRVFLPAPRHFFRLHMVTSHTPVDWIWVFLEDPAERPVLLSIEFIVCHRQCSPRGSPPCHRNKHKNAENHLESTFVRTGVCAATLRETRHYKFHRHIKEVPLRSTPRHGCIEGQNCTSCGNQNKINIRDTPVMGESTHPPSCTRRRSPPSLCYSASDYRYERGG